MGEQEQDGRSTALTRSRDTAIEEYGPDQVYGWVEAGVSTRDIARKLGLGGDDTAMWSVQNWLRRDEDRYEKAKRRSVEAHMELAGEVYGEEPPSSTAEAKWINDRSGFHRWVAEIRGDLKKGGVNVNVDLGQLHLNALRAKGQMPKREDSEPIEADYEIEGEEKPRDKYAKKQLGEIPGD